MDIILFEPEIPQNTGNIARSCALSRSSLHLIEPLGFSLEDRYLKRAGLDYWPYVNFSVWENWDIFQKAHLQRRIWVATTHAAQCYHRVQYETDDMVLFGRESSGLPESMLRELSHQIRIPMLPIGRSLNLSNAAAVILFEALRQHDFPDLE